MLIEEIRNIKSEKKDLRNFGLGVGIVLGLIGALLWWRGKESYLYFLGISSSLILCGLLIPRILLPLQKAWMTFAVVMGWFMTRLILSILFYFVFTTIGMIGKLVGKGFLETKIDKSRKSYWIYREEKPFNKENYERQF